MDRVVVIGTSCSGKTTMARWLAGRMDSSHIELDFLYWRPEWAGTPKDDFREIVARAMVGERWIVDGNYSMVRDIVWPRATHAVWLNYSFALVLWRACKRTLSRAITQETMWAGNRESFRKAFFSTDSIIWWVITTYHRRRRRYRRLFDEGSYPKIEVTELRSQREADDFVAGLEVTAAT